MPYSGPGKVFGVRSTFIRAAFSHTPARVSSAAMSMTATLPIPARRNAKAKAQPLCPPPTIIDVVVDPRPVRDPVLRVGPDQPQRVAGAASGSSGSGIGGLSPLVRPARARRPALVVSARHANLSSRPACGGAPMVQLAELDTERETLDATLDYFVDTKAMPVTLVGAPGESDRRTGGGAASSTASRCATGDSRPPNSRSKRTASALSITMTRRRRFLRRGRDPPGLLPGDGSPGHSRRAAPSASSCSIIPCAPPTKHCAQAAKIRDPVRRVHNDYTEWSGPQRVRDLMGEEAEALLAAPLCDHPDVAADPPPGRELAARDRRRAQPVARRHGGDRAPLSRPHRPDLGDHLEPGASLVLVPADAAGRGAGVQDSTIRCRTAAPGLPRTPPSRTRRHRRMRGRARASKSAPWRSSEGDRSRRPREAGTRAARA